MMRNSITTLNRTTTIMNGLRPRLILTLKGEHNYFSKRLIGTRRIMNRFRLTILNMSTPTAGLTTLNSSRTTNKFILRFGFHHGQRKLIFSISRTIFQRSTRTYGRGLHIPLRRNKTTDNNKVGTLNLTVIRKRRIMLRHLSWRRPLRFIRLLQRFHHRIIRLHPIFTTIMRLPRVIIGKRRNLPRRRPKNTIFNSDTPTLMMSTPITGRLGVLGFITF